MSRPRGPEPRKVCKACGDTLPLSFFRWDCTKLRAARICLDCSQKQAKLAAQPWDWANAIHKAQLLKSKHAHPGNDNNIYSARIVPAILRRLMDLQDNRCALTGESLLLPADVGMHNTLAKFAQTLPTQQASSLPVLVRRDPGKPWIPGNIMFIAWRWESLYESCKDVDDFRRILDEAHKHTPVHITFDMIAKVKHGH
jgi:hypothetical protein